MAVWPASLPQAPMNQSFTERLQEGVIRSQMDAGPGKARRRFTAVSRYFTCAYMLTDAQVAALDTFYVTTTLLGSVPFTFPHPRTKVAANARFTGPYQVERAIGKGRYQVSVAIEVLP